VKVPRELLKEKERRLLNPVSPPEERARNLIEKRLKKPLSSN
jgi:hypothetical protein